MTSPAQQDDPNCPYRHDDGHVSHRCPVCSVYEPAQQDEMPSIEETGDPLEDSGRWITYAEQLRAHCERLVETHRMQLTAISVAAHTNTHESMLRQLIQSSNPYWTVAYADTVSAVEREIKERERAESAESRLAALREECDKIIALYGKTNLGSHTSVQNFLLAFEDYAKAIRALKSNPTGRE